MKRSGTADLPIYGGAIPRWLMERMVKLSGLVTEAIVQDRGSAEFLRRLSDPFWFQSFAAVIGMDWNSSGATTALMAALKTSLNPRARDLGLYVCGGKGKRSTQTPTELLRVGEKTGLDGNALAKYSRLSAKVDNTAVQDGYQLYLHSFLVNQEGDWTVVQQGMQAHESLARRYHWHSAHLKSFVEEPHAAVCGEHLGQIVNLVHKDALPTQNSILSLSREESRHFIQEFRHMKLPSYCDVKAKDVDWKRLGSLLVLAQETNAGNFEELLLLKGMGPRALQSLALLSEVIYGTPARFSDPARFSFAHGGKSGRPFTVPLKLYDENMHFMRQMVQQAKMGQSDKQRAFQKLGNMSERLEKHFTPDEPSEVAFEKVLKDQRKQAKSWDKPQEKQKPGPQAGDQLSLF